jgi:hypothetical protein
MNKSPEFLSVRDLQRLMGTTSYHSAVRRHKKIREAILPGKRSLTLQEYCNFEGCQYAEIWAILRG